METKCGKFSVKSFYKALESSPSIYFLSNVIWKSYVQLRVKLLLWTNFKKEDGLQQIDATFAKYMRNRWITSSSIVPRQGLFGCCFSLFKVQWMLLTSIKATLLGWNESFVGKKMRSLENKPLIYFLDSLEGKKQNYTWKMMCCPSKDLRVLLFVFFGQRQNCS